MTKPPDPLRPERPVRDPSTEPFAPDPDAPAPDDVDIGEPGEQPIWWPNMEESRAILHDYSSQFEKPYAEDVDLPEDPDPGEEN